MSAVLWPPKSVGAGASPMIYGRGVNLIIYISLRSMRANALDAFHFKDARAR